MPTTIVLNTPTIEEQQNEFFQKLKDNLYDGQTYSKEQNSIGYTEQSITFNGTADASQVLDVYINNAFNQNINSLADGTFRFGIRLKLGKNNVQVRYQGTTEDASNTVYFQAFHLMVWFKAYADEFLGVDDYRKQSQQNTYLEDNRVDTLETSSDALRDNFGVLLKATRPIGYSRDQFRDFLENIRDAWIASTEHESYQLVSNAFVGQDCYIDEYYNTRQFPIGTLGKIRVVIT